MPPNVLKINKGVTRADTSHPGQTELSKMFHKCGECEENLEIEQKSDGAGNNKKV